MVSLGSEKSLSLPRGQDAGRSGRLHVVSRTDDLDPTPSGWSHCVTVA